MTPEGQVDTIVAINNSISAALARKDLAARGIPLSRVALILLRDIAEPWMRECPVVLQYPGRPATGLIGQWRFVGYYRAAAQLLLRLESQTQIREIYLVNNDNILTSHLLSMAGHDHKLNVTVVVEGIMNFQDIGTANRATWRWRIKPMIARFLGLRYRLPADHLSGAFEPSVSRVVSFATEGLRAPRERVVLRRFDALCPKRTTEKDTVLVVLTGLNQWMDPTHFEPFARSFVRWVESSGFRKIQVKRHPRVSGGLMEDLLSAYELVGEGRSTEDMAADLEAGTVVGTCCTALVTLKLMRPDLECVDFGSDYYGEHAYRGDQGVKSLFAAAGVKLVQMVDGSSPSGATDDARSRIGTSV